MHARLLDVLHDAADQNVLAVANRIDVDLDRHIQEAIQQHRAVIGHLHGVSHVGAQIVLVEDDLHGTAAEHIRRAYDEREAHFARQAHRLVLGARGRVRRLLQVQVAHQRLEALAVLGDIDRVGRRADDRRARLLQRARQFQRGLAAELHDDAFRLFLREDFQHVLESQGLEVQPVRGVIVGRDRLRVAIDHDGLEPVLAQLQGRVHTTVVELDALADAVRAAAQDHDLAAIGGIRLAFLLVGGIEVGGRGREFRRAGVDALVNRHDCPARGAWSGSRARACRRACRAGCRRSPCASEAAGGRR